MNKIIENLLLPKPEFNVGQVWGDINTKYQFVITDVTYLKEGIVRAMVLGEDNFGDKFDVYLKKEDYPDILTRDRCTMRITDGPIATKMLTQYHFSLTEKDKEKLSKALANNSYEYEPMQELVNAKYLNNLEEYHIIALNELENFEFQEDETESYVNTKNIIILILPRKEEITSPAYSLALAASSKERQNELAEFWDKEYKLYLEGKSNILFTEDDFIARLTFVDGNLYLVFYNAGSEKKIDKIMLKNNKTVINAKDKSLIVKEPKFTSFDTKKLSKGDYILSFNYNGTLKEFNIKFDDGN